MKKNNTIFTVIIILIIVILLLIKLLPNMLNKTNYDDLEVYKNNMVINIADSDKKQIVSYCHKLFKELKTLPHGFGATVGHSMILDDVKSMEDAINEATIEMRQAKEKMK